MERYFIVVSNQIAFFGDDSIERQNIGQDESDRRTLKASGLKRFAEGEMCLFVCLWNCVACPRSESESDNDMAKWRRIANIGLGHVRTVHINAKHNRFELI